MKTKINGWECDIQRLHPGDQLAKGVEGRIRITARKGARVMRNQVLEAGELATWNPDAAWLKK